MEIIYERCCGVDVHKKKVTVCIMVSGNGRLLKKEIKEFGTMTSQILEFVDWIREYNCECVAMESTASYWKPLYNILEEEGIKTIVVNAKHIKAVPGRKTDVKDSEWIADLLRHGLLSPSYIPDRKQRELREVVRYRRSIIQEMAREKNRVQKILEGSNIKISSIISDVLGLNGRKLLKGMIEGKKSPMELAELTDNRISATKEELKEALTGTIGDHQKKILKSMIEHIEFLENQIKELDLDIENRMAEDKKYIDMLDEIPGIGKTSAENILAEIGTDMNRFPSERHISSWAGVSPGNNESAGKKKSGKTTKGNKTLKSTLVECAKSAVKKKDSYYYGQYQRLRKRMNYNKATVAIAHSILIAIYHMIKNDKKYEELGINYFDKAREEKTVNSAVKKLVSLGYMVKLSKSS